MDIRDGSFNIQAHSTFEPTKPLLRGWSADRTAARWQRVVGTYSPTDPDLHPDLHPDPDPDLDRDSPDPNRDPDPLTLPTLLLTFALTLTLTMILDSDMLSCIELSFH